MNEENPSSFLQADTMALQAQSDAAAVARATQEIQAALVIAKRFERDEIKAKSKILAACQRKELAEMAEYEYSRGGTRITGPTVDLLRAIANRWGNIRYGWTEVDRRSGQSLVRCFAWDLQSNGQAERSFSVRHWRDTSSGGYALEDERDIYELIANVAARRVRACLEEVIDPDVVEAAIDECRKTLKTGAGKVSLADRAVQMLNHYAEFGVTKEMIEQRIGNKLEALSENQYASLRRVWKSLKDGVGKREDYFKAPTAKPEFPGETSAATPAQQDAALAAAEALAGEEQELAQAGLAPVTPSQVAQNAPARPAPAKAAKKAAPADDDKRRFLKAVIGLCKAGNIAEGKLLEHLNDVGLSDGSATLIEELPLEVLQRLHDNWKSVASALGNGQ